MQFGPGPGTRYLSEMCLCSRYESGTVGRGTEIKVLKSLFQFKPPGRASHYNGKDVWERKATALLMPVLSNPEPTDSK